MLPRLTSHRLIIFLKAPRPGLVKTRLAVELGVEAAHAAYVRLVEVLFKNLTRLDPADSVELRFTPDDAAAEIEKWRLPGWLVSPQGPGDLTQRLSSAMRDAFETGARRVVIIGSDCPQVTAQDIQTAWGELENHDVVAGPAIDGGYWLIGMRSHHPQIFEGIAWSTSAALAQTLERCRAQRLTVKLLRPLEDIDTAADWIRFCGVPRPD
ncbi:MAG: uncharacterized protein QOF48_1064 [Verrucomicrobiota bacterium]|jgi:rSAM/selenodomain-associated transferase 1